MNLRSQTILNIEMDEDLYLTIEITPNDSSLQRENDSDADGESNNTGNTSKKVVFQKREKPQYLKKDIRTNVITFLTNKLKSEKNSIILDKQIYAAATRQLKSRGFLKATTKQILRNYAKIAYNTISQVTIKNLKETIEKLKTDKVDWKDPQFQIYTKMREIEENIKFQDVQEGAHTCTAVKMVKGKDGIERKEICNGKRTVEFSLQLRSADEGMTTFIMCVKCSNLWKIHN